MEIAQQLQQSHREGKKIEKIQKPSSTVYKIIEILDELKRKKL